MFLNNAHAAQNVADYCDNSFKDSRAEIQEMSLTIDQMQVGKYYIAGKLTMKVAYDECADKDEQHFVDSILDETGLYMFDENGENVPLSMLSDKPSQAEIVDAINAGIEHWGGKLVEV